jgi:hypothetical protein
MVRAKASATPGTTRRTAAAPCSDVDGIDQIKDSKNFDPKMADWKVTGTAGMSLRISTKIPSRDRPLIEEMDVELMRNEDGTFRMILTEDQVRVIFECMGEMFAALDRRSFEARVGASADTVSGYVNELRVLMDREGVDL